MGRKTKPTPQKNKYISTTVIIGRFLTLMLCWMDPNFFSTQTKLSFLHFFFKTIKTVSFWDVGPVRFEGWLILQTQAADDDLNRFKQIFNFVDKKALYFRLMKQYVLSNKMKLLKILNVIRVDINNFQTLTACHPKSILC